jgi:hypothetical protein
VLSHAVSKAAIALPIALDDDTDAIGIGGSLTTVGPGAVPLAVTGCAHHCRIYSWREWVSSTVAAPSLSIEAEAESDGSLGYIMTDSDDDRLDEYPTPIPMGLNLFIYASLLGGLVCPVYPNRMPRGWNKADTRVHVLAKAHGL